MSKAFKKLRVLIVGCGNMGTSHAIAYNSMDAFQIVGLVSQSDSKQILNGKLGNQYPLFNDFDTALDQSQPDVVCIATYPDTHERFAIKSLQKGCHVFLEKPIADSVAGGINVLEEVRKSEKKLVVGYILRHHPSWVRFIELSKELGKPLVMRMNLNQQSHGKTWAVHLNLMKTLSPIVDCGVHYIDVMCQMTDSRPLQVSAIGARLTSQVSESNYNYGQLQIKFEDGSIGWYEAGWGPMMSETASFVKDVIGPNGSVSIVAKSAGAPGKTDSVDAHTKTESLKYHYAALDANDEFVRKDDLIDLIDEPDHQELCNRQQQFFLRAITDNLDLTMHQKDALNSLRIAFACDEAIAKGVTVML